MMAGLLVCVVGLVRDAAMVQSRLPRCISPYSISGSVTAEQCSRPSEKAKFINVNSISLVPCVELK